MNSSLPDRFFCVDVEAVATGRGHSDLTPCLVAVMDKNERVLLKKMMKVDKPIVSYMTPKTGIRPGDLDDAPSYEEVVREVKALLGRDAVLVGQSVKCDIQWMKLEQGIDYVTTVELSEMFKTYNPRYRGYTFFPLAHEANMLLKEGFIGKQHDPETDCKASLQLFKKYSCQPQLLERDKQKLLTRRPEPSFAKLNDYVYEGVCMAAFCPKRCICGSPTLANHN